ncbi:MAG: hypothetical protein ACREVZ_08405 [Burkholderiales bacterium]
MRQHARVAMAVALVFALSPAAAHAFGGVKLGYDDKTRIAAKGQPVYPEGIAYDPVGKRIFVGSARLGHLFTVNETGELKQFSSDERIATTLGIKVDALRGRVVAAVTDFGAGVRSKPEQRNQLAAVAVFDLATGKLLGLHDLTNLVPGPAHLANDVAIDRRGNIYVTDSLAHAIYKIDAGGAKSIFIASEQFKGEAAGFTLNGIDVHPDGYLLVVTKNDGKLFKVPLDDPKQFMAVKLPEPITAADGILLAGGDLLVIRNRVATVVGNEIVVLRSSDSWVSATIADRKPLEDHYATTATVRGTQIITVASRLFWLLSTLKDNPDGLQQEFLIYTIGTLDGAVNPGSR